MSRLKSIANSLERALVGTEKISPETEEFIRKYVHSTGRAKSLPSRKSKLLNFAIGPSGASNILKARYMQGGILGPGGVILGEMAPSQEYIDLIRGIVRSRGGGVLDPATGRVVSRRRATAKAIARTPLEALNPALLLGFPAYDISNSLKAKPGEENYGTKGMGSALGSGLGFIVGAPLGIVGALGVSHLGSSAGGTLGGIISSENKPNTLNKQLNSSSMDLATIAAKTFLDLAAREHYN